MTKSRKHREREKQRQPRQPQKRQAWWFQGLAKLSGGFLACCTALGIAVLWPRVTIDADGQIDPSSPYPISFNVRNTGFVALRSVQGYVGLCEIWIGEPKNLPERCSSGPLASRFARPEWHADWLNRDELMKLRLDDQFPIGKGSKFGAADISIGVAFSIWYMPWFRFPIEYRFQTRLERDGKLSWMPRPLEK